MFTRTHYERIAKAIADTPCREVNGRVVLSKFDLVVALQQHFIKDNPRFSVEKFVEACFATEGGKA